MRYWYASIETRCGEYEFLTKLVTKTEGLECFDAEEYAKHFYGGEVVEDDGHYYFNGGEIACCVYDCMEITEKEFKVLDKYL